MSDEIKTSSIVKIGFTFAVITTGVLIFNGSDKIEDGRFLSVLPVAILGLTLGYSFFIGLFWILLEDHIKKLKKINPRLPKKKPRTPKPIKDKVNKVKIKKEPVHNEIKPWDS